MIGGPIANEALPNHVLSSPPQRLIAAEIECLWKVFVAIAAVWGNEQSNPAYQRSQWLEFVQVKTETSPSYVEEYKSAILVLDELAQMYGEAMWDTVFFHHGVDKKRLTNRLAHWRVFVVEEFIKVWLTTGGFKVFGAKNYNSYVSGSRFAVNPAYRRMS